ALGRHHVCRADLEHLHDVRRLLGAEGRYRRGERLGVGALVDRDHLVVALTLVETVGQSVHRLAEIAAHGMPPLDFGLRPCSGRTGEDGRRGDGREKKPCHCWKTSLRTPSMYPPAT